MYVTLSDEFARDRLQPVASASGPAALRTRSVRRTRAGQALFREEDEAQHLYEVVSGVVRLGRVTEGGRRQVIAFGFPGDVLGFPMNGRYHTDCDVLVGGEVVVYPERILACPDEDPALNRYLMRSAMREIAGMQDHFVVLGRKCAIERTAAFLGVLAARIGCPSPDGTLVSLPMFRSDIADFLGLSSETVSRAFTHLKEQGIIVLSTAKDILVPDEQKLRALTERD